MKALIIPIKQQLTLILLSGLTIVFNPAMAESGVQTKEAVKNVKEKHSNHSKDTKLAGSRYFCESLFWASQPKQAAKT